MSILVNKYNFAVPKKYKWEIIRYLHDHKFSCAYTENDACVTIVCSMTYSDWVDFKDIYARQFLGNAYQMVKA